MKITTILYIIVIGLIILFTTQNTADIPIKFLFFTWSIPLIFVIYLLLFGGFFAGYAAALIKNKTRDKKNKDKSDKQLTMNTPNTHYANTDITTMTDVTRQKKSIFNRKK